MRGNLLGTSPMVAAWDLPDDGGAHAALCSLRAVVVMKARTPCRHRTQLLRRLQARLLAALGAPARVR